MSDITIQLGGFTFTRLCDALNNGDSVCFVGIDIAERGSRIDIPASIIGNLFIDTDYDDEDGDGRAL